MEQKLEKKIPVQKVESVKKLAEHIKNAKTLMIVSIKSVPSKQFQEIKKSVRGQALIKVAKKNILLRSIKALDKESILPLEKFIKENSAFVISDVEGYELAGILANKKTPVSAKAGQIAPEDIEVKAGPTDLVPGPAISELGALGIQIAVEDGKISIKAPRVIVKEGEEIKENVASILQKLNIQPLKVGLDPLSLYDVKTEKIYTEIKVDPEEAKAELKNAAGKALGFAQKIIYYCKDTIGYFLAKVNSEGNKLSEFVKEDVSSEAEEKKEETAETSNDKKDEKSEEAKPEDNEKQEEKPIEENKEESGEISNDKKDDKSEEVKPSENDDSSQNLEDTNNESDIKENVQLNNQEEKA